MKGFVTGLLARSLKPVTSIRPRLAMAFEPTGRTPEILTALGQKVTETDAAVEVDTVSSGKRSHVRRPSQVDDPVNSGKEGSSTERVHVTEKVEQISAEHVPGVARVPAERPFVPQMSEVFRGLLGHAASTAMPVVSLASPARITGEPIGRIGETVAGQTSQIAPHAQSVSAESARLHPPLTGLQRVESEHLNTSDTQNRRSNRRPDLRQAVRTASERETTVQVTIGRIEVRAEQPPETFRKSDRKPSSVMTLEEYLSHRSKRGKE